MGIVLISGVDTGIGKSIATAMLARFVENKLHRSVVTQKMVQTGNNGFSEDLELHRRFLKRPAPTAEEMRLQAPAIFTYPSSPHLAAEIDGRKLDLNAIKNAAEKLSGQYDCVLVEGAGGLCVPLTRKLLTVDFARDCGWPLILVTGGKLGSINHTVLSLEAVKSRKMVLKGLIYNNFPSLDPVIEKGTVEYLKDYLAENFPGVPMAILPEVKDFDDPGDADFTGFEL